MGALLVGYCEGKDFVFGGNVGTVGLREDKEAREVVRETS